MRGGLFRLSSQGLFVVFCVSSEAVGRPCRSDHGPTCLLFFPPLERCVRASVGWRSQLSCLNLRLSVLFTPSLEPVMEETWSWTTCLECSEIRDPVSLRCSGDLGGHSWAGHRTCPYPAPGLLLPIECCSLVHTPTCPVSCTYLWVCRLIWGAPPEPLTAPVTPIVSWYSGPVRETPSVHLGVGV